MATYICLPLFTILLTLLNVVLFVTKKMRLPRKYTLVMAAVMAMSWLVVVVIWGHCHTDAGTNPDNPWYQGDYFSCVA